MVTIASTAIDAIGGAVVESATAESVRDLAEAGVGGVIDPGPPPDSTTVRSARVITAALG